MMNEYVFGIVGLPSIVKPVVPELIRFSPVGRDPELTVNE
jgi:hypothetical protein